MHANAYSRQINFLTKIDMIFTIYDNDKLSNIHFIIHTELIPSQPGMELYEMYLGICHVYDNDFKTMRAIPLSFSG